MVTAKAHVSNDTWFNCSGSESEGTQITHEVLPMFRTLSCLLFVLPVDPEALSYASTHRTQALRLPQMLVGVLIAIGANTVIPIGLNLQKYAHRQAERQVEGVQGTCDSFVARSCSTTQFFAHVVRC